MNFVVHTSNLIRSMSAKREQQFEFVTMQSMLPCDDVGADSVAEIQACPTVRTQDSTKTIPAHKVLSDCLVTVRPRPRRSKQGHLKVTMP